MRLLLAALLALGAVPAQAGPVLTSGARVAGVPGAQAAAVRIGGVAGVAPVASLTASLTPSLAPGLSPSLPALQSAPSLSAAAPDAPSQAAAVPALAAPVAAAGLAPALAAPAEAPKPGEQESAREHLESAAEKAAVPREEGESPVDGRLSGAAAFDGAKARESLADPAATRGRWRRRGWLGSVALVAGGGSLLLAADPTRAVPAPDVPAPASAALEAAAQGGLLHGVGQAGYVVGNALAFIFPAFEIYRAYKTGSSAAMPAARAALLIGSSLAVGLFVLTLSGLPVWAVQNIFGGLALGVVWPSAWVARRLGVATEGKGFSLKAAAATVATAGVTLGLSAAFYHFIAAPFVPMLVKAAFGAAAIGAITLGIQLAAALVQAFLFAPELIKLYRGRATGPGFSPGFTLALTLASMSFVVYSVVRLLGAPFGSASMWQFALYTGLYLLYAVTSGATWWLGRRKN